MPGGNNLQEPLNLEADGEARTTYIGLLNNYSHARRKKMLMTMRKNLAKAGSLSATVRYKTFEAGLKRSARIEGMF